MDANLINHSFLRTHLSCSAQERFQKQKSGTAGREIEIEEKRREREREKEVLNLCCTELSPTPGRPRLLIRENWNVFFSFLRTPQ